MKEGTWPKNDVRRAFVAGAKWWEFKRTGATMWQSDQTLAEEEATRRYKIRTCQTMHECCLCKETIRCGQNYRDGGYGRRAHVECADNNMIEKKEKVIAIQCDDADPMRESF